jgi:hypothetical protein
MLYDMLSLIANTPYNIVNQDAALRAFTWNTVKATSGFSVQIVPEIGLGVIFGVRVTYDSTIAVIIEQNFAELIDGQPYIIMGPGDSLIIGSTDGIGWTRMSGFSPLKMWVQFALSA